MQWKKLTEFGSVVFDGVIYAGSTIAERLNLVVTPLYVRCCIIRFKRSKYHKVYVGGEFIKKFSGPRALMRAMCCGKAEVKRLLVETLENLESNKG